MVISYFWVTFISILLSTFNVSSATSSDLFYEIEQHIKKRLPRCDMTSKNKTGGVVVYKYKLDDSVLSLSIDIKASAEAAHNHLEKLIIRIPVGPTAKEQLGDEAYCWINKKDGGCVILARKGTACIQVNSVSYETAKNIADIVIEKLSQDTRNKEKTENESNSKD